MIITEISCDGYLAQLAEEVIGSYDTAGDTVTDIVTALLAFQRKATKITKGTIAPTATRALKVENKTILAALLQLKESVGGYIDVDGSRVLNWTTTIGDDIGQQIRYRKNLKGITKETNYNDLCTKLHPLGGVGVKLSDIDIVAEEPDKDSDDDYGYLTLIPQYACYLDWVAVGNALPAHVNILAIGDDVYTSPDSVTSPDGGWYDESNAKDEDTNTFARSDYKDNNYWTEYIYMTYAAYKVYTGVRFHAQNLSLTAGMDHVRVQIDTAQTGDPVWSTILESAIDPSWNDAWHQVNHAAQKVRGARIRFQAITDTERAELNEFEAATTHEDVTSVWKQGANERTMRCAKEYYDAEATYRVNYTHAGYLIAWDKIVTDDDLISKTLTNKYEGYASSLLVAGRLLLDEVKEVPVSYTITTVDLSEVASMSLDFDALKIGSTIKVIDEELGISVSVRVVKIIHPDLLRPQDMEVEITNRLRDISDVIAGLYKELG